MIIVHLDGAHKPVARDGDDVHVWIGKTSMDWVTARDNAWTGEHEAFVARKHVFVFQELEAEEKLRLRKLGKLVELDQDAHDAFFALLSVFRTWRFFFENGGGWRILARVAENAAAWEQVQQLAAALRDWARTWPPGEPTRAGFAAVRALHDVMCLPIAWCETIQRVTPSEPSLPLRWVEALKD